MTAPVPPLDPQPMRSMADMGMGGMDHGAGGGAGGSMAVMNHGSTAPAALAAVHMNHGAMNHGAMNHGAMNHGAMPAEAAWTTRQCRAWIILQCPGCSMASHRRRQRHRGDPRWITVR